MEHTVVPPQPPKPPHDLRSLYPPELGLQLVQVLLRHGECTPATPSLLASAGAPTAWPLCTIRPGHARSSQVFNPVTGLAEPMTWVERIEATRMDSGLPVADSPSVRDTPDKKDRSVCGWGILTDRGRRSTFAAGQRLRNLYVQQLGFLPANLDPDASPDLLYLRSSKSAKVLESLMQASRALYPRETVRGRGPLPITARENSRVRETLHPITESCQRLREITRVLFKVAIEWDRDPRMMEASRKLGKWLPKRDGGGGGEDNPVFIGFSRGALMHPIRVMDTIKATMAHEPDMKGLRLPAPFYDPEVEGTLDRASCDWFAPFAQSQEARLLGPGALVGELVGQMVRRVRGGGMRMALIGCHDTTIAGTLTALGLFDWKWPPFTSTIVLELFRRKDGADGLDQRVSPALSSIGGLPRREGRDGGAKRNADALEGYFVRIRYNDRPMVVPGCRTPGSHLEGDESFCTLAAFKAIVDKITPSDRLKACQSYIGAPVSLKHEPAGF